MLAGALRSRRPVGFAAASVVAVIALAGCASAPPAAGTRPPLACPAAMLGAFTDSVDGLGGGQVEQVGYDALAGVHIPADVFDDAESVCILAVRRSASRSPIIVAVADDGPVGLQTDVEGALVSDDWVRYGTTEHQVTWLTRRFPGDGVVGVQTTAGYAEDGSGPVASRSAVVVTVTSRLDGVHFLGDLGVVAAVPPADQLSPTG